MVELEKRVQKTERRGENTHSQALQALKKYGYCRERVHEKCVHKKKHGIELGFEFESHAQLYEYFTILMYLLSSLFNMQVQTLLPST